jgi:RHS repeat-associated protein
VILTNPATPTMIETYAAGLHLGTYVLNSAQTATVLYYDHADWLGTERARADLSGNACEKISSLPFGDGQTITGTCGDISPRHFTGKERDPESGLDNFGARYDSSSMGRFMSPDPLGGRLIGPQTLNKYSYVANNPINSTDPTGLYTCKDQADCKSKQDMAFEKARQQDLKSKDPNVVRAAQAYGDPTKDNGVGVQFGDPGKGNNGITANNVRVDPNDPSKSKVQAEETVTIRPGQSSEDLAATVGHEGSHVADAQDFVGTLTSAGAGDQSKNLTKYQTELAAYLVSQSILASESVKRNFGDCGLNPCILGTGITPAQAIQTINQFLANPANHYGVTPDKPGPVMYPNLTTPK